jgi:hypothetical protein
MTLLERIMPWYKRDEQAARTAKTNDVALRVQESMKRVTEAQDRATVMVQSYERAGGRLWKQH